MYFKTQPQFTKTKIDRGLNYVSIMFTFTFIVIFVSFCKFTCILIYFFIFFNDKKKQS